MNNLNLIALYALASGFFWGYVCHEINAKEVPLEEVRQCYFWDKAEIDVKDTSRLEWYFVHYGMPSLKPCVKEFYEIPTSQSRLVGIDKLYSKWYRELKM